MSKRREKQAELLPTRTRAEAMADKHADRLARGLVRTVVYIPVEHKEKLSRYVETRLDGEYKPR